MHASLARLLHGAIDYAGLFPPAKLNMRDAVDEYVDLVSSEDSWIVSRFICPASRLMELERELARAEIPDCVPLAVVGTGGADIRSFQSGLESDVAEMN